MARILIVYGTTEGHTAQIAERMAAVMRDAGHEVDLRDSKEVRKQTLTGEFDGAIVGGSIHTGDHQSSLRDFVKGNRGLLERVPSAFFSVSLSAVDQDDEAKAEVQAVVDKFVRETGWKPERVETFGGALVYTQYNFFVRHMMKLIVKQHGRTELDSSRDYDFTDWGAVEGFAREFASGLAGGAGG
jgi:menaquinone-dependent protoporphyrinogen oxidase